MAKAEEKKDAAPAKSEAVAKGEQAAPLVKAAVQQHGDAKDQRVLENFEDDPELYDGALKTMLTRLADGSTAFAQQLQTLAQQANIQTGGVQDSVTVSGQGRIYGVAGGVHHRRRDRRNLIQQRGVHACHGTRGHGAARGDVGGEHVGTVAEVGIRQRRQWGRCVPMHDFEERYILGHRGKHLRSGTIQPVTFAIVPVMPPARSA